MSTSLTIDRKLIKKAGALEIVRAQNKSGLELWSGDSVVLDIANSSATNIAVKLSTTSDDIDAYGVVLQTIASGDYGEILRDGPVVLVKVDGNTDIAAGDELGIIDGATYPDYTTGDVAVSAAGATVTGNGTTFTAAMKGRKIYFGSETLTYRITAVGGATTLTISPPYRGAANISGSAYVITAKGIAMKASAGKGGAFAKALAAYSTNDSYGTIAAVMFKASSVDSTASKGTTGGMAAAGTSTANAIGTSTNYAPENHVHALGTHTHAGATTGANLPTTAFAADTFTANAAGRLPFQDGVWTTAKLAAGVLSADVAGRALVAAGWLDVTTFQSGVAAGILSADATGRAFMATGYFNAAAVLAKFGASSFDAAACLSVFADGAIPGAKVNFSFGETPQAETCDASGAEGTSANVARADHVHAITCAAPSAGLAAADAEGAASTFARSNHVHKAVVTDNVTFFFGASDDCGVLFSTTPLQDAMVIFADDGSRSIHICDATSKAVDFNVAVATDPTLFIHSATTPATDYLKISVSGVTATIQAVGNTLDLTAVGSVTVNEASADVDTRIESADRQYMFAIDGAKNAIILGDNSDNTSASTMVLVSRVAHTGLTAATYSDFRVTPAGAYTTLADASTYPVIASARFDEPNITVGAGDTVTVAATVYISAAPTEGAANYALDVASGASLLQALTLAASPLNFTAGAGFVLGTTDNQTVTVKTNAVNKFGFTVTLGQFTVYQATANYTLKFSDPGGARDITFADPGASDSVAYLAASQTFTTKTLTAPTIGGNVTLSSGQQFIIAAATSAAFNVGDGTGGFLAIDTRLTIDNIYTHSIAGRDILISNVNGTTYNKMSLRPQGITLSTATQVTAMNGIQLDLTSSTISQSGGAVTVVTASTLYVVAPTAGGSVTITNNWAINSSGSMRLDGNLSLANAAYDIIAKANTAAALEVSDGTVKLMALDTRSTTDSISMLTVTGVASTIALSVTGSTYSLVKHSALTHTFTAKTNDVTAMDGLSLYLSSITVAAGAAITVVTGSTLYVAAPTAGANISFTNNWAINCNGAIRLDGNLSMANAAYDIIVKADTAAALEISNATVKLMAFDTRATTDSISMLTITGIAPTIALSVAGSTYSLVKTAALTFTFTAKTNDVTAMDGLSLYLGAITLASGAAITVGTASQLYLTPVVAGATITITNNYMINTSVGGCFLTAAGAWTDACSREHKTNIEDVDLNRVPGLLESVHVKTFQRKDASDGGFERFGCIAEEVPDFLASKCRQGIAAMDMAGFALAAIKWLKKQNEELETRIQVLEAA